MNRAAFAALAAVLSLGLPLPARQTPSAEAILEAVDRNAIPGTKIIESEMVVHGRRDSRTIRSKSWIEGDDKAFTEYLYPPREEGTKMLKLGDQLWTYSPSADRTIRISGSMLRQSVMGSDLSYEDMMENKKLVDAYAAAVAGEAVVIDRPCWILELKAKEPGLAYEKRKVWVDKERYVVLREERFARSGKLLKTYEVRIVLRSGGRWVPEHAVFKDVLKEGEGTEFKVLKIEFDAVIPAYLFDKAGLRK
jgi:outer membrane lipoprotein-sorting protein